MRYRTSLYAYRVCEGKVIQLDSMAYTLSDVFVRVTVKYVLL